MGWKDILKGRNTETEERLTDYFDNLSLEELNKVINEILTTQHPKDRRMPRNLRAREGYHIKDNKLWHIYFLDAEEQDEPDGMSYRLSISAYKDDESGDSFGGVFVGDDGTIKSHFEIIDKEPEQESRGENIMGGEWRSEAGY
jgi:hypothetical protein